MGSKNDGIYIVINGQEYKLEYVTPFDDKTKCEQCDFLKSGKCTATVDCLKIEVEFPDAYWKKTMPVSAVQDSKSYLHARCYNKSVRKVITFNGTVPITDDTSTTNRFIGEFNCK